MPEIRETDCVFRATEGEGTFSITIEPRAGGWAMHLNLRPDSTTFEEAEQLARRLRQIVASVTAQPNDPFVWIEPPGTQTKQ